MEHIPGQLNRVISVIVPAWGETPFLERALASVPDSPNIEVVVSASAMQS